MYNKQILISKIEDMFENLKKQSYEIIAIQPDFSVATKMIVDRISSEAVIRSKTLFTDMYAELSENTLSTYAFESVERKNRFYEANIRGELLSKYKFDVTNINAFQRGIQYKEVHSLYLSLAVAAGVATLGGVLKYALANAVNIPIVIIIAGAVAAFCVPYFKVIPNRNKASFCKEIERFLSELKKEFILWFDEIEKHYNKRVEEIVNAF